MPNPKQLRPQDLKKTLARLFSYFKYNLILLIGGLFFIILGSIAEIAVNGMLSPVIDTLVGNYNRSVLIKYLLIMGFFVILIALGQYLGHLFMARLSQRTVHKIRSDMFAHMEKLPISYFDRHAHGDLMSTFTNDVDMLTQSLEQGISQVTISAITLVVLLP